MRRAIAIVGPTAAGKGELGREVARRLGRAVLVCDSVKVYRGLDIGSGKPTREMQAALPHRLIDLAPPDVTFSAGDYAKAAWSLLPHEPGVFVGGTGFYLRQVAWTPTEAREATHGDRVPADFDATWRAAELAEPGAIWRALERIDPATASRIHAANLVRLVRALWLCERHGEPVSQVRAADPPAPRLEVLLVVLDPGPEVLAARIERRVDAMLAAGFRGEVEMLRAAGYHAGHKAMQSLGYRQMLDHVEGRTDLASARADIIAATRRYARRQRTYFRHQFPGATIHTIASASACPWGAIEAFAAEST
jgi:tRNA dimethylallyltransferase